MRWAAISKEPVERLLPIAHMTGLDQSVRDVRAANRWAGPDLSHHLRFANRHTKGS
jgi:hypothetical protein